MGEGAKRRRGVTEYSILAWSGRGPHLLLSLPARSDLALTAPGGGTTVEGCAASRHPSSDRGFRKDPRQPSLLYRDPRHAAGEALRQSGRRQRVSPLLCRCERPRHRSHVLRLARAARKRGTRSIVRTSLRVRRDALAWWLQRFNDIGVKHGEIVEHDGRYSLAFEDPEGQRLALVDDGGKGDPPAPWERSPVPAEMQIRGLGPILMSVPMLKPTDELLTRVFNMKQARDYPHPDNPATRVHVFEMSGGGARGAARGRAAGPAGVAAGRRRRPSWRSARRMPTTMHGPIV